VTFPYDGGMGRLTPYIREKVPTGGYTASCCAVWCFDARFGRLARLFEGYQSAPVDFVAVAGGAKAIADGGPSAAYVLEQVAASLRLHHPGEIVLMVHEDCGAYGRRFASEEETRAFFLAQLDQAAKAVTEFLRRSDAAGVKVRKIFADFNGLWEAP
jgi:hypothetical protein